MRERETLSSRFRVALLGFGTVGSAVARRLVETTAADGGALPKFQLTHVFDRRADEKRDAWHAAGLAARCESPTAFGIPGAAATPGAPAGGSPGLGATPDFHHGPLTWTTRIEDVLQSDADLVVEAIGGVEPAADWIRAALAAGKSVVTANKQVMARHGFALLTLAARQGRQLRFEAAVGGAMPIVRALGEGLAGDRITRVVAILNGTTNAVFSRMEATGCSLEEALGDARARGYAEADPSADLDGSDARAKLAILCALAFGLRVDPSHIATRSSAWLAAADFARARARGGTVRQLAHAEYDRAASVLTAWVAPAFVTCHSFFGKTTGAQNAALITGAHSGETGIFGAGAGGGATAVAVMSDIVAIARDRSAIVPPPVLTSDFRVQIADLSAETSALSVETPELHVETSRLLEAV
ncbi:MAG: homoserine dehydrogenase [Acidobacteria bacterium]|nr:MAG: homoserine dehydrogenase [Acidobacteriota bacterium]